MPACNATAAGCSKARHTAALTALQQGPAASVAVVVLTSRQWPAFLPCSQCVRPWPHHPTLRMATAVIYYSSKSLAALVASGRKKNKKVGGSFKSQTEGSGGGPWPGGLVLLVLLLLLLLLFRRVRRGLHKTEGKERVHVLANGFEAGVKHRRPSSPSPPPFPLLTHRLLGLLGLLLL